MWYLFTKMHCSWGKISVLFILALLSPISVGGNVVRQPRTVRAVARMLGLGPWCVGCPAHYCDDDPNIIQGYCCGCARFIDYLPITCPSSMRCPMNTYQLCLNYEYMMQCCC